MLRVLGRGTSGNVQKVVWLLEELGKPYGREDYGRQFNNTQDAAYLKLNPNAKVPTLVDGDVVVWESNTILRYLAASIGQNLHGATPAEKTDVERWMDFLLAAVNPGYLAAFKNAKLKPEEQTAESKEQVKDLVAQLKIVDGHLAGKDFLALGRFTIADIACAPVLKRCVDFKIDRPSLPHLEGWCTAIAARPAFKAATGAASAKAA